MFNYKVIRASLVILMAGVLASGLRVSPAGAQSAAPATGKPSVAAAGTPYRFPPNRFSRRASMYYGAVWGVDSLGVKLVESGQIIRFTYRVLDADKAKPLNDKKAAPSLIDPEAGVQLVVPELEQVGQLRQSSTPEAGKSYWMAFSNRGRVVKRGDLVDVVIGQFHANGLVVE
jgi:hypothetical protein